MGVALAVVVIPSLLLMTAVLPRMLSFATSAIPVEPAKVLIRLVKLGFLPTDAVVSQRTASKELNQSMRPRSPAD